MKVGVYTSNIAPIAGGGYTFESDVCRSLLDIAGESRHTFTVFCAVSQDDRRESAGERVEIAPCVPRSLAGRALAKGARMVGTSATALGRFVNPYRTIYRSGVEFMWYMNPTTGLRLDIPYLAVVWDLQHRLQPWFPEVSAAGEWAVRETFYSSYLRRAATITTGTQAGSDDIQRFYGVPPERLAILPLPTPGFALEAQPGDGTDVLRRYGLRAGYIIYPAQFWSHKNHRNLLLAMQRLKEQHGLSVQAVFVGSDKGNQAYVRRLAVELNLTEQVLFLGFVSQQDLVALYRNALALAFVTFFGPDNLPPLEAFALGCPVVASDVEGAREQLGEAALLVDPRSPEDIATALKRVKEDSGLREELVRRGRQRASQWTAHDFVRGVFSILDDFESVRRCWGIGGS